MTIGFQTTAVNLLQALVIETAVSIEWKDENTILAIILDLNMSMKHHSIRAKCQKNIFSNEVEQFQWETILLDGHPVENMTNLKQLGLNEQQCAILEQNIEATDYLESFYEQCRSSRPKLLQIVAKLVGPSVPLSFDPSEPKAYANLLAQLPSREALLITETCGNIDGSTGNPLKNVMFGSKPNAIEHHPIPTAFKHGISQLKLVSQPEAEILEAGSIPAHLSNDLKFYIDKRQIPMNRYAVEVSEKQADVKDSIDAFVLLSKRSFMPLKGDYQIKTSFPGCPEFRPRKFSAQVGKNEIKMRVRVKSPGRKSAGPKFL